MKPLMYVFGGVTAALMLADAAHAGSLNIVYWGKDGAATVELDGQFYDIGNSNENWALVKPVYAGSHTLVLHANGGTTRKDIVLSDYNVAYATGEDAPAWCVDLEDDAANILSGDDCDDMMDYYFDGW